MIHNWVVPLARMRNHADEVSNRIAIYSGFEIATRCSRPRPEPSESVSTRAKIWTQNNRPECHSAGCTTSSTRARCPTYNPRVNTSCYSLTPECRLDSRFEYRPGQFHMVA